jgi:WD40 repeat protein/serine/threonine protein kinase
MVEETDSFSPGSVLADRYRLVRQLGRGGMGCVYLADDLRLEQQVALKLLYPWSDQSPDQRSRLLDEVRFARRVSHANVCRVYDVGESDEHLFLVMEHIDGRNLREMLAHGALPEEQAVEVGGQICRGLAAIHEQGLLHRDLKPANVMIDASGQVRLTDFGLAVSAEAAGDGTMIVGTPAYMAPEQLLGEVSIRSDIYALGMVLHEIFTGLRAYPKHSLIKLARRYWAGEPVSDPVSFPELDLQLAGLDPGVAHVIRWCLATEPDDRPSSAEVVEAGLQPETGLPLNDLGLAEGDEDRTLRTLLVSDLVSSTALVETLGDARAAKVFKHHDQLARGLLSTYNGVEIDKTDGFLLLFERPLDAVLYALAYHQGLQELSAEVEVTLASRVGIHLGELYLRRNPTEHVVRGAKPIEVEGLAKAITARLMSVAGGGQTLLTRGAFDLARRAAVGEAGGDEMEWLAHGRYLLKGVDEPVDVFEVGRRGIAPLVAPADSDKVKRMAGDESILGWRPAPAQTLPGRKHWRLENKLGEGGFGEVWLARHAKTSERRVFKFCFEAEHLRSLRREVTLFRLLKEELGDRHDIARVLDWSFDEPPYYLESEYAAGGSLIEWYDNLGGIDQVPLDARLELVAQAAEALGAAHSVGVLHKDIKPRNILVSSGPDGEPQVRLTDFGIGQVTDRKRLKDAGITILGMTEVADETDSSSGAGSRLYMAPEVLEGKTASLQADIYALGVVLYQLVIGNFGRALAPGWQRGIPDELLVEDIAACVDGDPSSRLGSAGEFADRLRKLEERRLERRRQEQAEQAIEALARSRKRRRVLTVAILLLTLFTVWNMVERRRAERLLKQNKAQYLVSQAILNTDNDRVPAYLAAALRVRPEEISSDATQAALNAIYRQFYTPRQIIGFDRSRIESVAFSPDGVLMAIADRDHIIHLWNLTSGEARTFKGHEDVIRLFSFSPDGELLASGSWDKTIRLWDIRTGEARTLKGHDDGVMDVEFSPDGALLASASYDKTVRLWDIRTGEARILSGHVDRVWFLSFSPCGALLASASHDKTVRLWGIRTGESRILKGHEETVGDVLFSPDGTLLASRSWDKTVRLWDVITGEARVLKGHKWVVSDISFSPDGELLASASSDKTVRLWDVITGEARVLKGHEGGISDISFSPDGEHLASASYDRTVRLWDIRTGEARILKGHEDIVNHVSFSPDGAVLRTRSRDNTVRLWLVREGEDRHLKSDDETLYHFAISSDGTHLAATDYSPRRSIYLWHKDAAEARILKGHNEMIVHLSFSPDGELLASGSSDNTIRLWDVRTGAVRTLRGHDDAVMDVEFSPDGALLASASDDKTVRLWDVGAGEARVFKGHEDDVMAVGFSPGGDLLASASLDKTVRLWDVRTGEARILRGYEEFYDVMFSPDGTLLVSKSLNILRIWDVNTGEEVRILEGHEAFIRSFSFSPDGVFLASGSLDATVRLWDLNKGEARVFKGHRGGVTSVSFSPGGSLASCSEESTRVWDICTGEARGFEGAFKVAFSPDGIFLLGNRGIVISSPLPEYMFPNRLKPVWLISRSLETDEIIYALEAFSNWRYDEETDELYLLPFTGIPQEWTEAEW